MDASRPVDHSLNDLAFDTSVQYDDLRLAKDIIKPGDYLCKIDLSNAFRIVNISEKDKKLVGYKWTFTGDHSHTYLQDNFMIFGSKVSPFIFKTLSKAVTRIAARFGFNNIIVYLDDYLCISK